jgi:signal transduction histidine kinase
VRSESEYDADGAFVGRVGAIVDVSDLKRAQEELARHRDRLNELVAERSEALERSHEALRRSERLAAVGSFAAGIAHQINNPVGGILLAAQYALAAPDDRPRTREALRNIAQDARHCGRIVRGVLEFARGPKQAPAPCDLNAIARRCAQEIAPDAEERGARLRLELEEGLAPVAGSEAALEQVIVSLVWNAVEASAREVVVKSRAGEDGIELAVVDDGIALPQAAQGGGFDPLGSVGSLRPGMGLGLALAQGIAQAHGASVEVRGGSARGTSVSVRFPRWA